MDQKQTIDTPDNAAPNGVGVGAQSQQYSQIAQIGLVIIARADIKGQEVDGFIALRGMLAAIAQGRLTVGVAP